MSTRHLLTSFLGSCTLQLRSKSRRGPADIPWDVFGQHMRLPGTLELAPRRVEEKLQP